MNTENAEQAATIPVALTAEEWKVIGFLVRRGALSELEQQLNGTGIHHKGDCLTGFVDAYKALSVQLPELLPQVSEPENT